MLTHPIPKLPGDLSHGEPSIGRRHPRGESWSQVDAEEAKIQLDQRKATIDRGWAATAMVNWRTSKHKTALLIFTQLISTI